MRFKAAAIGQLCLYVASSPKSIIVHEKGEVVHKSLQLENDRSGSEGSCCLRF